MPPPRSRLLPDAPRWLLVLVVGLACVEVATASVPDHAPLTGNVFTDFAHRGVIAMLQVATSALLLWRIRTLPVERTLWRRLAGTSVVLSVAMLVSSVLAVVPATSEI